MANAQLTALGDEVEAVTEVSAALSHQIREAVKVLAGGRPGIVPEQPVFHGDTHAVLVLITHFLPGWSVSLSGTATRGNGNWTCTLRNSAERDDDSFVGLGRGPTLPHALLAAFLKAAAHL